MLLTWTCMAFGSGFSIPLSRGTGKGTILNGLSGKLAFKPGISYASGMTYQLDMVAHAQPREPNTPLFIF